MPLQQSELPKQVTPAAEQQRPKELPDLMQPPKQQSLSTRQSPPDVPARQRQVPASHSPVMQSEPTEQALPGACPTQVAHPASAPQRPEQQS